MATRKSKKGSSTKIAGASSAELEKDVELLVSDAVKGANMKTIGKIICAVLLVAAGAFVAIAVQKAFFSKAEPTISTTDIQEEIVEVSDLATAQLNYRGLVHYEEGNIKFIDKKGFTMVYDAEVKAGVDLSQAAIDVSGKTITITLPAATMQSIEIDPNSLEFYDQQYALFNWQNREDTAQALEMAQENAQEKVDETELLKQADDTAKTLVENLLKPFTIDGLGYTVNVVEAEESGATSTTTESSTTTSTSSTSTSN